MDRTSYGHIRINLSDLIIKENISKNKFKNRVDMEFSQLNKYCNNEISRVDLYTLARLCSYFNCGVGDILEYIPGDQQDEES